MSGSRRNRQHKSTTNNKCCSVVMIFSWALITVWALFIIYCYNVGLLDQMKISTELDLIVSSVDSVINKTEHSLLRFRHKVATPMSVPLLEESKMKDEIHVIFSTDCSPYQDWQTLVVFHSAKVVGQKGRITRIASGCDTEKQESLLKLYAHLYPNGVYTAHFTPDFKKDEKTNKKYDFYNKPWGLKHWLDNSQPPIEDEVVVALIDPDMIFVRPLTTQIRDLEGILYNKRTIDKEFPDGLFEKVGKGLPVAQTYGLGAPWTDDHHKKFNRRKICGEGSPCLNPDMEFGEQHYSVGPPYVVQKRDLHQLARTWTTFVPRVYEGYPYLLAEMYAYSMAAAHDNLPHLQVENYMVSNTESSGEGWPLVDALEDACVPPDEEGRFYPGTPLPIVVHYCQSFISGEFGFEKRAVPHDLFSCESPMLMDPPDGLAKKVYMVKKKNMKKADSAADRKTKMNAVMAKRNAYTLCVIYRAVNAALLDYKQKMCAGSNTVNYERKINVHKL